MSASITVVHGAATHPGLRRKVNEDAYLAKPPLFLVADGMGGHQYGDVASRYVVEEFDSISGRESLSVDDLRTTLQAARNRVNGLSDGPKSAGTTLSGVALTDVNGIGYWIVMNVGDSRTYRFCDGVLEQVSIDHSVVQDHLDSGEIDEARRARRNIITRAIGAGNDGAADFWMIPVEASDRILVCSDGLSNELLDRQLVTVLSEEDNPQQAAIRLVREAMLNGGKDNITVIVVDAVDVRLPVGGVEAEDSSDIDEDTVPRIKEGTLE